MVAPPRLYNTTLQYEFILIWSMQRNREKKAEEENTSRGSNTSSATSTVDKDNGSAIKSGAPSITLSAVLGGILRGWVFSVLIAYANLNFYIFIASISKARKRIRVKKEISASGQRRSASCMIISTNVKKRYLFKGQCPF